MRKPVLIMMILALAPAAAFAHPYDIFGTGPRAVAMGGAYAGISDDIAGLYYNVAGIANVERLEFEFGYLYGSPKLMIDGNDLGVDKNKGTNFGLIVSQVIYGHRLSIGVNIFIPDDHVLRFMMLPSRSPRFTMYTNRNHALICLVGGALEIFDWWNFGVGLNLLGDNFGGVNFVISETSPSEGSLESKIGSIFSPIAGMWFDVTDFLDVGVSYREKIQVDLDLPNVVYLPDLYAFEGSGIPILTESELVLLASSFSHFSPRQFQLGTAWNLHRRLLLSFDLTYYFWSEFKNPTPKSVIILTGGLGDLFPVGPSDPIPDPEFRDVLAPSLGMEVLPLIGDHFTLATRAGYNYRPTPAPDQKGLSNFADSDTHVLSAGLGCTATDISRVLLRPISLNLYFQAHLLEPRKIEKTSPADTIGDYEITGTVLVGGANITLRF